MAPFEPDAVDEVVRTWRTELPEVTGLPLELAKRIARLATLFDTATSAELERLGLTRAEYEVLARLRSAGPPYRRKPNDLTKSLLLSSGGTTNVLHRLTDAGLVTRDANPDDRRSSWVRLTAEGMRKAEQAILTTNRAQALLLDRLPEPTARALADLLRDTIRTVDPLPHIR